MGGRKVLIVEDEGVAAFALELELRSIGFNDITTISSGEEALQFALRKKPDVIFMDIHLEGNLMGTDVVRQLHTQIKIPIIYMTASQDTRIARQMQMTDYVGILQKPYLTAEIIKLVYEIFP